MDEDGSFILTKRIMAIRISLFKKRKLENNSPIRDLPDDWCLVCPLCNIKCEVGDKVKSKQRSRTFRLYHFDELEATYL